MIVYGQHIRMNEYGIQELCPFDYLDFYEANIHPYGIYNLGGKSEKIYNGITGETFRKRYPEGFPESIQILHDEKLSKLQEELKAEGKQVCMFNLYILCLFFVEKARTKYVALLKPTVQETLSELKGVSRLSFTGESGVMTESTSKILIETVLEALEAKAKETVQEYEVEKIVTWNEISNKALLQSYFVHDLSLFLNKYFPVRRKKGALVSAKEKELILYLLKLFGLSQERLTDKRWFQLMNYYERLNDKLITSISLVSIGNKVTPTPLCFIPYSLWSKGKIDWTFKDSPRFNGEIGCTVKF